MSRTGLFKIVVTAALFGLSTSLVSIGLVKAAHNFPHRAAVTSPHVADRFPTVPSDHLALLIANSNYPDAEAAMADVAAGADVLASVLRNHGFLVIVVRNATRAGMTEAVDRLTAAARPGSVVLVYFGGFGVQSEGQNFMIPVDAKIWQERDVRRDGVQIERALSALSASGARIRIAIVDASRRNPYERRFRSYSHGLAPISAPDNALILSSASPGKVADDGKGENSVLISELLSNLDAKGTAEAVFNKTRVAISRASEGDQVPTVSSSLLEDVHFDQAGG